MRVIRVVRLARVIRLLKSDKFVAYLHVFGATIKRSASSFGLLATIISLQIILFGSLFYVTETGSNPDFSSIPMGAFFTVVTITTVGYGDMVPETLMGRVVAILCMFSGLLVVALPVIIVGGNFEKEFTWFQERKRRKELRERAQKFGNANMTVEQLEGISKSDRAFSEVYNFLLNEVNRKCGRNIFDAKDAEMLCAEGWTSVQRILGLIRDPR